MGYKKEVGHLFHIHLLPLHCLSHHSNTCSEIKIPFKQMAMQVIFKYTLTPLLILI